MLSSLKFIGVIILAGFVASLAGCSGGGSGGTPVAGSTATPLPSSGTYAFALKAQGATSAPTLGISLVHPSAPGVEFTIEPATSAISDVKVVSSGTVTVGTVSISKIQPYALLYIVGGDVRRLPLVANGKAPLPQVRKAGSTVACKFVVDANDYAAPDNSRYIVSTAGADGKCGNADDGQGEVTLDATGGISFAQPYADNPIIGMLRDPGTLAPSAWVQGNNIHIWNPLTLLILRSSGQPPLTRVLAQTYKSVVAEYNNQLTVVNFSGQSGFSETKLDPVITAGTGWQSIGFDSDNYYVYRNSGTTAAPTWSVIRISQTAPAATQLASGIGLIQFTSMGSNLLYATVTGASSNSLLTINKTLPGVPQIFESTATSILSTVLASNSGVHQLWRISGINGGTPSYAIKMIDEFGTTLYSASGGFPLAMADAATLNLNVSENRSRFVFATGYGARGFGDASLVSYAAGSKAATTLGTLPGTSDYGSKSVFASITTSSTDFMTGFAASIASGSLQNAGAKMFSINLATPGSLKFTTSSQ